MAKKIISELIIKGYITKQVEQEAEITQENKIIIVDGDKGTAIRIGERLGIYIIRRRG